MQAKSLQSCPTLCDPMDCIAHQAPLSMGFSRQEYKSGLPCPSPKYNMFHQRKMWNTVIEFDILMFFNGLSMFPSYLFFFIFIVNVRYQFSSVQFSRSATSDSLWPHGVQHARPPCSSSTPKAYSNSCPSSWWCHPTISSSVIPFLSHLQSFPASGSCAMSQLFTSGGQSIGASASATVPPMDIQDWFL